MRFNNIGRMASVLLASTAVADAAHSADLAVKALAPIVQAVPYTWTGFSIFGFVGWGEINGSTDITGTDAASANFLANASRALGLPLNYSSNASGVVGGGGVEYDYQIGQFVLGVRGDYTYFGENSTNTVSVALNRGNGVPAVHITNNIGVVGIASLDGVIGFSPGGMPNLEIYADGGPAFGQVSQELIVSTTPNSFIGIDQPFNANTWGWKVGGGARYAFSASWYAQLEANFFDLTNVSTNSSYRGLNYRPTTSVTATDVTFGIGWRLPPI